MCQNTSFEEDECVRVPVAYEAFITERQSPIAHRIGVKIPRLAIRIILEALIENQFWAIEHPSKNKLIQRVWRLPDYSMSILAVIYHLVLFIVLDLPIQEQLILDLALAGAGAVIVNLFLVFLGALS